MIFDQYGKFVYNGNIYHTRNAALDASSLDKNKTPDIKFIFHDDVFSSFDWKTEPEISLTKLYSLRAKQLREKYDYLILLFSGGVDSDNMVRSFINSNIFIDEIQTYWPLKLTTIDPVNDINHQFGYIFEYHLSVLPKLKEFKYLIPKTKINVVDTSNYLKNNWNENFLADHSRNMRRTRLLYIPLQHYCIIDYCTVLSSKLGKKVGVIYGADRVRPYVDYLDEVKCQFYEFGFSGFQNVVYQKDNLYTPELFYWTKDAPLIPIKQLHLLKKELETNDKYYYSVKFPEKRKKEGIYRTLAEHYANKIIYPMWDNSYQKLYKNEVDDVTKFIIPHSNDILDAQDKYLTSKYPNYNPSGTKAYSAGKLKRQK